MGISALFQGVAVAWLCRGRDMAGAWPGVWFLPHFLHLFWQAVQNSVAIFRVCVLGGRGRGRGQEAWQRGVFAALFASFFGAQYKTLLPFFRGGWGGVGVGGGVEVSLRTACCCQKSCLVFFAKFIWQN